MCVAHSIGDGFLSNSVECIGDAQRHPSHIAAAGREEEGNAGPEGQVPLRVFAQGAKPAALALAGAVEPRAEHRDLFKTDPVRYAPQFANWNLFISICSLHAVTMMRGKHIAFAFWSPERPPLTRRPSGTQFPIF